MAKYYDITPSISAKLGVFPGDQAFQRAVALDFIKGDHLTLSSITTTLHLGAHADAPSHYHRDGVTIDKRSPARYMGKAQVVHAVGWKRGERVGRAHVKDKIQAPRVLVCTDSFPDPNHWNEDFCSFAPEFLNELADQGVKLVGIDTPSVDPQNSKALEAHQVLFKRDLAVLEGLVLKNVPAGVYTLLALPLPIVTGDASPVRAVLLPLIDQFPELE